MGYYSSITGKMTVEPALPETWWKQSGFTGTDDHYFEVKTVGEEETVGLVNGAVAVIPGNARNVVEFAFDESGKFYDFGDVCEKMVHAVHIAGSRITGRFHIKGEENGDISRCRTDGDGIFYLERPRLVWPNGETEKL